MANSEIHTRYEVRVVGQLWQGTEGTYQYDFKQLPTPEDVRAKAGDFSQLYDYKVVKVTGTYTRTDQGYTQHIERETVKSWDNDSSGEVYADSVA